jgi:hypothetical protein
MNGKRCLWEGLDYGNTHATFFVPANPRLSKFQKLARNHRD